MIVKPSDIHVMRKERICNTIEGKVIDSTHVEMLGTQFLCPEIQDCQEGENVLVEVPFGKVELMDNKEDGQQVGDVRFILYKGDHYHLTVRTADGENLYVDTTDVWDDGDIVGIRISPDDMVIRKQATK